MSTLFKVHVPMATRVVRILERGPQGPDNLLATVTGIDGKVIGTTNLLVTTAEYIITGVTLRLTTVAGYTSSPTAGVGVAAGEDDVLFPALLKGLNVVDEAYSIRAQGTNKVVASGVTIKLGIDVGAVATTYTLTAYLEGYKIR